MSAASAFFRETLLGQVLRLASGNKLFQYPEEKAGFVVPDFSKKEGEKTAADSSGPETLNEPDGEATDNAKETAPSDETKESSIDLEKAKEAEPVDNDRLKGAAELAIIASKSADIVLVDCEHVAVDWMG